MTATSTGTMSTGTGGATTSTGGTTTSTGGMSTSTGGPSSSVATGTGGTTTGTGTGGMPLDGGPIDDASDELDGTLVDLDGQSDAPHVPSDGGDGGDADIS